MYYYYRYGICGSLVHTILSVNIVSVTASVLEMENFMNRDAHKINMQIKIFILIILICFYLTIEFS